MGTPGAPVPFCAVGLVWPGFQPSKAPQLLTSQQPLFFELLGDPYGWDTGVSDAYKPLINTLGDPYEWDTGVSDAYNSLVNTLGAPYTWVNKLAGAHRRPCQVDNV